MTEENNPRASESLFFLALLLLSAGGFLWILDEQDKQKREQAIGQVIKLIDNPNDRFVAKTLLEKTLLDEAKVEKLREAEQIVAAIDKPHEVSTATREGTSQPAS